MIVSLKNRLKKNADFLGVLRGKTKKIETEFGRIVIAERRSSATRFGFVVSKKVLPNSVARNLVRRRASEWVRKNLSLFRGGIDVVVVFERGVTSLSRHVFYQELERACKRAGLFVWGKK